MTALRLTAEGRTQRERILRAAIELVAAHGYRGASLNAVAAAVGKTRQAVLHYFPSKVHLLDGVLDQCETDDTARIAEILGDRRDLAGALLTIIRHHQDTPAIARLYTILAAETIDADHPGHQRFRERYTASRARMARAVEEAQQAGQLIDTIDPPSLATLMLAVMDGLQLQFLHDPEAVDMVAPFAALLTALRPAD